MNKNRIDIMVDLETLGTESNSTIFQVAAASFNITTGEIFSVFNRIADISKNERPLKVSGKTIQWWLQTNKELFCDLLNGGGESSEEVLRGFSEWVYQQNFLAGGKENLYLWGNGILFDNKMIQQQLENLGITYPIFYRNDRDVRTVLELASIKTGVSEKELKEKFRHLDSVAHNALDDVENQIRLVVGCIDSLMNDGWKSQTI